MTICVAAIGENGLVIAAADRMKTGGDIEFEPRKTPNIGVVWGSGAKIFPLTVSIVALTAGDSSLQVEILQHVFYEVHARIKAEPDNWWRVEEVANLYISHYDRIKRQRASSAILGPLGLDSATFLKQQAIMSSDLVASIARDLQNFDMPAVQTIFTGVDHNGSHIFVSTNCNAENVCQLSCSDNAGFAAIGSGSRHALSQFMLAGYHRQSPTSETMFQTYLAKKRAEIAPGVGQATDMVAVGPGLGVSTYVEDDVVENLEAIYQKYSKAEVALRKKASDSAEAFQKKLLDRRPQEQAADAPETTPPVNE